ncbi:MAG: glycosyltransferase family A protein [Rhodospirillales bacterium]
MTDRPTADRRIAEAQESRPPGPLPLVSVLVPTFRRPRLLPKALASLLAQEGLPTAAMEILVIDNCPDASARAIVARIALSAPADRPLRYLHEPRPGISHPRNAGIAAARGRYVLFLDDDQTASPGLLGAYLDASRATAADALFGPVKAILEPAPGDGSSEETDAAGDQDADMAAYFSRRYDVADRADITDDIARLGTNNAFFDRTVCFPDPDPFDPDLGTIGGEDTLVFRTLAARGIRFAWVAGALAHEFVPQQRQNFRYVRMRRFRSGQIRVLTCLRMRPARRRQAAVWMAAGLVQTVGYGIVAAMLRAAGRHRWRHFAGRAWGGAGKLLWMERFRFAAYGATSRLSR